MNGNPSAIAQRMASCPCCTLVSRLPEAPAADPGRTESHRRMHAAPARCPRCDTPLHLRKPASIERTIALLVAAFVLYIPANLLPIMRTQSLLTDQSDTIMSGIVYLWRDGSWVLAIIVFVASITVPLVKLIVLSALVWAVKAKLSNGVLRRARLYRLVEFIGRWSMLDIYVASLLGALVHMRSVANVDVGPAAIPFGCVVVLTLLAARTFDPRLLWDVALVPQQSLSDERQPLPNAGEVSYE